MQVRRAGTTGLELSTLGLGTIAWGSRVDEYEANDILHRFRELGGTLIDTSPAYGRGQSVELLATAIDATGGRDGLVIASRCGLVTDGESRRVDVTRSGLLAQLDTTLAALKVDHLDLWQLDQWDDSVPLAETLSALAYAVNSGKVRHLGAGSLPAWQVTALASGFDAFNTGVRFASAQAGYSLIDRGVEHDLLPALRHRKMALIACSPLGRGALTGKYRSGVPGDSMVADPNWEPYVAAHVDRAAGGVNDALGRAADGLGVLPTAVALGWVRNRPGVASVVVGVRSVQQLDELAANWDAQLPEPIASALDDVTREE